MYSRTGQVFWFIAGFFWWNGFNSYHQHEFAGPASMFFIIAGLLSVFCYLVWGFPWLAFIEPRRDSSDKKPER